MDAAPPVAEIDLTLPSDARYLSLVRVVVAAAAAAVPSLVESRIADLKLVATELFTNAMEANWRATRPARSASGADPAADVTPEPAPVRIVCTATASGVTLVVADSGPGLDAPGDPHPPVDDPRRLDHERGLGIPLIQYLADRVDYVTDATGTRATVVLADRPDR